MIKKKYVYELINFMGTVKNFMGCKMLVKIWV